MSPTYNGSTLLQCFKHDNAIKIHNRITFDFYRGTGTITVLSRASAHGRSHLKYQKLRVGSYMEMVQLSPGKQARMQS